MFRCFFRVMALLPMLIVGTAEAAHFDTRYVAKYGHANSDQLTDIYLQYRPQIVPIPLDDITIPIPLSKREVGDFVLLQQANGAFVASVPTSQQLASFGTWPSAAVKLLLSDMDADSNIDLLIKNVSSIVPGAKDLIVYAPGAIGAQPSEVRAFDDALMKFIRDVQGWAENQSYFANAWIETTQEIPWPVSWYDCDIDGGQIMEYYWGDPNEYWAMEHCEFLFTFNDTISVPVTVFDSTNYSSAAKSIADALQPFSDATTPVSDAAIQTILAQTSTVLGRPYYPDALPGTVDWDEMRKMAKVLARGAVIVAGRVLVVTGGVLFPSETADSDLSDEWESQAVLTDAGTADASRKNDGYLYLYHTTLSSNVASILNGISAPAKRNFSGDVPGFYLATNPTWAYNFGRSMFGKYKSWVTIQFRMTGAAHTALLSGGAYYRFHPQAPGLGTIQTTFELIIPPHLYGMFNSLMGTGAIVPTALPPFRF